MITEIILLGLFLIVAERIFPDQFLEKVPFWWTRVLAINVMQLSVVLLSGKTWEIWLDRYSLIDLDWAIHPAMMALPAYFLITFVFYWWHRVRHDWMWAWNLFHQIHHSPARIETITSFYKHPLEIMANSLIISTIVFFVCGFSLEVGAWLTFYTALGEFIYHMNIKTPFLMGYIFQRPEMHRIHHQRGKHYNNFSDLPVWDMLFGTWENPQTQNLPCGFRSELEVSGFGKMLRFVNVLKK